MPGSGFTGPDRPGVELEINKGHLPRKLADAPRPGLVAASVCTGALLLGAAGLTHGRPCVTHQTVKDQLAACGGVVTEARGGRRRQAAGWSGGRGRPARFRAAAPGAGQG
ncbi:MULTISPECIES: hypothetical protein [Micromonospora]|uniref:hypothetical protein n=1 Tax=Micromonospora TaxID=1873 RepID=UPI0009CD4A7D|nr:MULTISPECIES: hypothetical protein [unclassified Micromonospora]MDI5939162.1 hypothetical protein [Micromonospora sp. DH15]OON28093.1 hypothetical protein BSA16_28455 [Micromonospora sp. Rc5]